MGWIWQKGTIFVDLDCGKQVWVSYIGINGTYSGCYTGVPSDPYRAERVNSGLIASAVEGAARAFGPEAVHLIEPLRELREDGQPQLPGWQFRVQLEHHDPVGAEGDASVLIVIFYVDSLYDEPLPQIITRTIKSLDWNALAKDYLY